MAPDAALLDLHSAQQQALWPRSVFRLHAALDEEASGAAANYLKSSALEQGDVVF